MTKNNELRITPIGGIEEIGKNATLYEINNKSILVDCGFKFSSKLKEPGTNNIYIDYNYLLKHNKKNLKALVITHAHLDHIGGIPLLLQYINLPIYCSRFTKEVINLSLSNNHPHLKKPTYQLITPNAKYTIDDFEIEFITANHSIIDSFMLSISTPAGVILHSGDYRIDLHSEKKLQTDISRIKEISQKQNFLALLSDSTNSMVSTPNITEKEVVDEITDIIKKSKGRIIIACFSTQIIRLQLLIEACKKLNKKIFFAGRSLQKMVELSLELKILKHSEIFLTQNDLKNTKKENMVIFTTGTQGEPSSGLQLMSLNKHRQIKLDQEDTIIMSSSVIPGNDLSINEVLNNLIKKKLTIITNKEAKVHVSGHGSRKEISTIIEAVNPKYFIPVHGEPLHLNGSRKEALKLGMKEENIFIRRNGTTFYFKDNELKREEHHNIKKMYKDGKLLNIAHQEFFNERTELHQHGVINVILLKKDTEISLLIKTKGFINRNENKQILKDFEKTIKDFITTNYSKGKIEEKEIISIKKMIKNNILVNTGKKPILFFSLVQDAKIIS